MAFLQDHQSVIIFLQKGKLVLRSLLSEGRYFRGDSHFRDSLTSVTFYCYFRRFVRFFRGVVTFGTSGNNSDPTLWKIPVSSASDQRSMSDRAKIRNQRQPLYSKRPHDLPVKEI